MTELETGQRQKGSPLLGILLVVCWAIVLAKTYFLLRGHPTPTVIDYTYIIALPTALWNLKTGLDLLGIWFYLGVLSVVGLGAIFWIVRAWRRYLLADPKGLELGWNIFATILAINFVILILFVGRELVLMHRARPKEKYEFEEPPTHPEPSK